MRSHRWPLAISILLFASLQLAAQTTSPTIYSSTGNASTGSGQILAIDGSSGTVTGVCTVAFSPEDVVVGPDGLLYVADPSGNRVWRLTAAVPAPASTAASCPVETIYDRSLCTGTCPSGPEGPSFVRVNTLDLYFNTHGTNTGVWKIPGIAAIKPGSAFPAPVQVIGPFGSGEGVDFDIFGNLLAVDQANGKVLRATAPTYGAPASLITGLSLPFGVAINTCNNVVVTSGSVLRRYNSSGALLEQSNLAFKNGDNPRYLEFDAANNLYVTTASGSDDSGTGGKVWRYDAPSLTNCALKSYSLHAGFPVVMKTNLAPGITMANALGLGISPTNVASATMSFTAGHPSNLYSFGAQHSFSVTCNTLVTPFNMSVTVLKARPTDAFDPDTTFSPNFTCPGPNGTTVTVIPVCAHYGSHHGFCDQYVEHAFDPATGQEIDGNAACTNFTFKIGAFTAEIINNPGGAHSSDNSIAGVFDQCQSLDYYPSAGPGLDWGLGVGNDKHVAFNSALQFNGHIALTQPTASCGIASLTCNPQFTHNQNVQVKFNLLDSAGNPVPSSTFAAAERLSILRIKLLDSAGNVINTDQVAEPVVPTNGGTDNFFGGNAQGLYSLGFAASALDANANIASGSVGIYQLSIWGNGAPPFAFDIRVTF